jgi:hypothetical protein
MDNNIFDALHGVRLAFKRADLEAPAAIVLKTHEDGMRFLSALRDSGMMVYTAPHYAYKPVEHPDGSIWMEAEFAGMKIHWPANRYATQAGGYVYG